MKNRSKIILALSAVLTLVAGLRIAFAASGGHLSTNSQTAQYLYGNSTGAPDSSGQGAKMITVGNESTAVDSAKLVELPDDVNGGYVLLPPGSSLTFIPSQLSGVTSLTAASNGGGTIVLDYHINTHN